jgi:hypothetical protein
LRVVVTQLPRAGILSGSAGFTLGVSATHTCGGQSLLGSVYAPSTSSASMPDTIMYQSKAAAQEPVLNEGSAYDSFSYVICSLDTLLGPQVFAQRVLYINIVCSRTWYPTKVGGQVQCLKCPLGTAAPKTTVPTHLQGVQSVDRYCVSCPPGHNRSETAVECGPCPAGTHARLPGAAACSPCAPGTLRVIYSRKSIFLWKKIL